VGFGLAGTEAERRVLPLFPLPNTVFFPETSLELHVFEPRYKAMVRDVTAAEGLIVVSLAAGRRFLDLGTVGRIRDLMPLQDGGFNLRLEGLERVSLTEIPRDTPYRQVQAEPRPERTGTDDSSVIAEARLELLASYGMLRSMVLGNEPLVLHQDLPFEVFVNKACDSLPIAAPLRQRLLDEDSLIARQRLGLEYFSTVIDAMTWIRAMKGTVAASA
jgi:Lon protease-like protein